WRASEIARARMPRVATRTIARAHGRIASRQRRQARSCGHYRIGAVRLPGEQAGSAKQESTATPVPRVTIAVMGPLTGLRVLEFEAIGPGPFCGMLLADMGADVLLVDRAQDAQLGFGRERWYDVMMRGRRSVTLDLKTPDGVTAAIALAARADAVIEGFRPGVMERLGL